MISNFTKAITAIVSRYSVDLKILKKLKIFCKTHNMYIKLFYSKLPYEFKYLDKFQILSYATVHLERLPITHASRGLSRLKRIKKRVHQPWESRNDE